MSNTNNSNTTVETSTTTAAAETSTTVETPVLSKFNIESGEQALALYLDAKAGRESIEEELVNHELYMSSICKDISAKFGNGPFDLGDGNPRGHIIVKRGDLFFIRGRNSGRPVGSGKKAVQVDVASVPAALAAVLGGEGAEELASNTEELAVSEQPKLSAMDQALAIADAEIAEQEAASAQQSAE